jgi:hypothetical protein
MPSRSSPRSPRQARQSAASAKGEQDSTAQYIADMTAELAGMAESAKLEMLTYFLKMARMEAEAFLRGEK